MRPHEKLDVWKKSIDFVVALFPVGFSRCRREFSVPQ
jgi:hypothetical protein